MQSRRCHKLAAAESMGLGKRMAVMVRHEVTDAVVVICQIWAMHWPPLWLVGLELCGGDEVGKRGMVSGST